MLVKPKEPQLTLVVPTYNEEKRLPDTLQSLGEYRRQNSRFGECIVIDDGSVDDTLTIARRFARTLDWCKVHSLSKNYGKGHAVKIGLLQARYEYVFYIDADLSPAICNLEAAVRILEEGADIVIGSRVARGASIEQKQPLIRRVAARCGNALIRWITGLSYRDTQCGFKGFRRDVVQSVIKPLQTDGYLFDVELLARAADAELKVVEMPVRWAHRPGGNFRLLPGLIEVLIDLGRIKRDRL